ncbi:MAG: hypothetical protein AUJ12_05300 [Alphaproteobacteria bacterium CG1_02_46_17]|nr:MAG: hypothetical protein AUJ12_05300 [Alphaproteobacteria bacterium CG1_02_46_17]
MKLDDEMSGFLTEDQITEIFARHLVVQGYEIKSRAMGRSRGADIVATLNDRVLCIEAKGGGAQSATSRRFGKPFTRLQCQSHTDVAFACIPRMMTRYKPDYVGIILPDDKYHFESLSEILPAIKTLGAGVWLIGSERIKIMAEPVLQIKS